jgi:diketogulonate reductase-like aldo/keto reductase
MRAPPILYGTAWKEDATRASVERALRAGFRGIDTANQRKHYHEAAVGEAIAASIAHGELTRDALFLQTKFTFRDGQDHRLPYDPHARIATQVRQSFESSLVHLGVAHLDSYVLHGPSRARGLGADDWEAWDAMERLHDDGLVRDLGVSNVDAAQLEELCTRARIRPTWVQNRCFASRGFDAKVREVAARHSVVYQGFSLLTANADLLARPALARIAAAHGRPVAAIVFRFAQAVGMVPLSGTTNERHMRDDLDAETIALTPEEVATIAALGTR